MLPILSRLSGWVFALLVLLSAAPLAVAQSSPGAGWVAVLVAGDNAQPVFANAVGTFAQWLAGHGGSIHLLSAGSTVPGGQAEPASGERVLGRVAALAARPGQRCLVYITSHGRKGQGVWLAASRQVLQPEVLAQSLSQGCASVPTVVVVSACFSGGFAAGAMQAPNRILITAARPDRQSFGCRADRTYTVFDECLLGALPRSATWRAAFDLITACVAERERQMGMLASEPQAFFGTSVRDLPVP